MRRFKATVFVTKKGKVGEAHTKDRLDPEQPDGYGTTVTGYIVVPLKKGRSRAKGNEHEIDVAKAFSRWLYGDELVLRRTPLSGGWGSGKLGDITMDPVKAEELKLKRPRIYVECRNYDGVLDQSFWRYMETGKPTTIGKWIEEVTSKAKTDYGFLVIRDKNTPPWVMLVPTKADLLSIEHTVDAFVLRAPGPGRKVTYQALFFPLSRLGDAFMPGSLKFFRGE